MLTFNLLSAIYSNEKKLKLEIRLTKVLTYVWNHLSFSLKKAQADSGHAAFSACLNFDSESSMQEIPSQYFEAFASSAHFFL